MKRIFAAAYLVGLTALLALPLILLGCRHEPPPAPTPQPEYSPAVRIAHGEVGDVWRLHLESKLIGSAAVTRDGKVLIPLRVFGEAQSKRVDWDKTERAVFIGGKRVPSPVYLIIQTSYATPQVLSTFPDTSIESLAREQTVIIHSERREPDGFR